MSVAVDEEEDEDEMLRAAAERARERAKHLAPVRVPVLGDILRGIKNSDGQSLHKHLKEAVSFLENMPGEPAFARHHDPIAKFCVDCKTPLAMEDPFYGRCQPCFKADRKKRLLQELKAVWKEIIPEHYHWAKYDAETFHERVKFEDAADLERFKNHDGSILLHGASSTGKTSLAVCKLRSILSVAREAIDNGDKALFERGKRILFTTAFALCKATREHPLGEGRPFLVERAIRASVLVLDELGVDYECYGAFGTAAVREVLHERFSMERPTIVCSYLERGDVVAYYGDGIARRLGEGLLVKLGGGR